jgi:hypothetical protein
MDDDLFSDDDKRSAAYRACMVGAVGAGVGSGVMVGRWLGVQGLLAGAAAGAVLGLVVGLKTCPRLAEPIKRKLFTQAPLTEKELLHATDALAGIAQLQSRRDALDLLALARWAGAQPAMSHARGGLPPPQAAQQLLRLPTA